MKFTKAEALQELGLSESADEEHIRRAYKKAAMRWHPDKNQGDPSATAKFQRVNAAYHRLQQESRDYDDSDDEFDFDDEEDAFDFFDFFFMSGSFGSMGGMGGRQCNCPDCQARRAFSYSYCSRGSGNSFRGSYFPPGYSGRSPYGRGRNDYSDDDSDDEERDFYEWAREQHQVRRQMYEQARQARLEEQRARMERNRELKEEKEREEKERKRAKREERRRREAEEMERQREELLNIDALKQRRIEEEKEQQAKAKAQKRLELQAEIHILLYEIVESAVTFSSPDGLTKEERKRKEAEEQEIAQALQKQKAKEEEVKKAKQAEIENKKAQEKEERLRKQKEKKEAEKEAQRSKKEAAAAKKRAAEEALAKKKAEEEAVARRKAEQEENERLKEEAESAERERREAAALARAEEKRLAKEKAEAENKARMEERRIAREKADAEAKIRAESEKKAREKAEAAARAQRQAREKEEAARMQEEAARMQAEAERRAREQSENEAREMEAYRLAMQQQHAEIALREAERHKQESLMSSSIQAPELDVSRRGFPLIQQDHLSTFEAPIIDSSHSLHKSLFQSDPNWQARPFGAEPRPFGAEIEASQQSLQANRSVHHDMGSFLTGSTFAFDDVSHKDVQPPHTRDNISAFANHSENNHHASDSAFTSAFGSDNMSFSAFKSTGFTGEDQEAAPEPCPLPAFTSTGFTGEDEEPVPDPSTTMPAPAFCNWSPWSTAETSGAGFQSLGNSIWGPATSGSFMDFQPALSNEITIEHDLSASETAFSEAFTEPSDFLDFEATESAKEKWRNDVEAHLRSLGLAMYLKDLAQEVRRPAGLRGQLKDVLNSDPQMRFRVGGEGHSMYVKLLAFETPPQYSEVKSHDSSMNLNYSFYNSSAIVDAPGANSAQIRPAVLAEQWRIEIEDYLKLQGGPVLVMQLGVIVKRPNGLKQSLTSVLASDTQKRFTLEGEGHSLCVGLASTCMDSMGLLPQQNSAELAEIWRQEIEDLLYHRKEPVLVKEIGALIRRPDGLRTALKTVLSTDPEDRFVFQGENDNLRATLSESRWFIRQKWGL